MPPCTTIRSPTLRKLFATLMVTAALAAAASSPADAVPRDDPPAAPAEGLTTPQLVEAAVASGALDRATADLHLAQALGDDYSALPAEFQSVVPWEGTLVLRAVKARRDAMAPSQQRTAIDEALSAESVTSSCSDNSGTLTSFQSSAHFYVEYSTIGGGLTITDYLTSLETAWTTQVDAFGWAAPPVRPSSPPPGNLYHVRIATLGGGLYGFVSSSGTYAGAVGNNPNTPWNDGDAQASCMVLNRDYTGFPGSPQRALDATTAHEFNHSIQYGYGALNGANVPDDVLVEGGATWMEDEVQDASDDNYNYLHPNYADSLGDYDNNFPYPYWIVLRALTERFGTGVAGGGEDVMQAMWEAASQNTANNVAGVALGLTNEGITLADAYHDAAVAMGFLRTCGGGYTLPDCFEESAGYITNAGVPAVHKTISSTTGSVTGTLEDDYSLNWVAIPSDAGTYPLTFTNTSSGGTLRASAVCDTGTTLVRSPFPSTVTAGQATTLAAFNSAGCVRSLVVLTNQQQSAGNPSSSAARGYSLVAGGGGGGTPTVSIADTSVAEGNAGTTPMVFTATLSAPAPSTVTVNFATLTGKGAGTATSGTDFTATSGTITFATGATTGTATVNVNGDTANEANETFTVRLSAPSGATIADDTAIGTITNDDGGGGGSAVVSIGDASVVEGPQKASRAMTFTVSIPSAVATTVTVTATTSNGTAIAPGDYAARTAVVTIPAGSTSASFVVTVKGDNLDEANETFTVTLSGPTGATIGDGSGVGTITDDD
jgi:hypothetical protein